jgi:RNA polymerase sigma factor (sigma-70 family)
VSAALSVDGRPTEAAVTARDLYERHGQRVFSFCMSRLRNPEEAQDAAQTTFMYVLTALKRGVVPRNELAWLLTIAENVCRASRRTLVRRNAHVANADVDELETAALSVSHETREEIRRLRLALELLPESQRRAILLREWQGLSYADIAEQLDLSLAAVETLLFRARKGLGRYVDRSRARFGALNAASLISVARSLVSGGTGKVAVGVAGLAIAVGPAAERDLAATTKAPPPAMTSAAASRAAPIRSAPRARPRPRAGRA